MDTGHARTLFNQFSGAVAYIEVEKPDGSRGIGTATHVGEGVFVTARHVVEGNKILSVGSTERVDVRLPEGTNSLRAVHTPDGAWPAHLVDNETMSVASEVVFHPHPGVDLAAFQAAACDPLTPWVPLGDHLDDWIGIGDFVLSEVIVMGYPPIPTTREPFLVATRAEVNSQVDYYDTPHVHWILSSMARGGLSGAMVIDERGIGLGVVGRSVTRDAHPEELGYMSATSIEPVYTLLSTHKMLPVVQDGHWDGFWNNDTVSLEQPSDDGWGTLAVAQVTVLDDGRRLWIEVSSHGHPWLQNEAARAARTDLGPEILEEVSDHGAARLRLQTYDPTRLADFERARENALAVLENALPGATRSR